MSSKPQSQQLHHPTFTSPTSPQSRRTIRRFQSHQTLSSNLQTQNAQNRPTFQRPTISSNFNKDRSEDAPAKSQAPVSTVTTRGRARSNSDVTSSSVTASTSSKKTTPGRKSLGFTGKRSGLDALLRDGPPGDDIIAGLRELRYYVLSTRVDADSDGMV